jgi:thioredoxin reductase
MEPSYSSVVIGGGAAGLTAALVLGRARVPTLLVDAGGQSNRPAHAIGGLLGHTGSPADLYAAGRAQLAAHPAVEVADATVEAIDGSAGAFEVRLADGRTVRARRLLLAAGMDYARPPLPGIEELWGDTVFHCPYCHGWEVAGRPLAVLGTNVHQPLMLTAWSDDIVLFTDGAALARDDEALLTAAGITIERRAVAGLRAESGKLAAVRLADGTEVERAGLLLATPLQQRSELAARLGLALGPMGEVAVDPVGRTSVAGIFAAGDVTNPRPNITTALAQGTLAAVSLHHSLLVEDVGMPPLPS